MDTVTQRTAASAEESASAAQELSGQAETLMATVRHLQAIVKGGSAESGVDTDVFPLDDGHARGPSRRREEQHQQASAEFQQSEEDTQVCQKF
jgi:methyl-accepting chemotaxis protein